MYSDYLWNHYCEKLIDKVIQKEDLNSNFNILGDMVRGLADEIVESFDLDLEQSEDQIVSVILVYNEDSFKILGCQVMGKQDISQIVNAVSVAISCKMTIQQLAAIDVGGLDGETKPWGVLQMAAATALMEIPDFDGKEFDM